MKFAVALAAVLLAAGCLSARPAAEIFAQTLIKATRGDIAEQVHVGDLYGKGQGTEQDFAEAMMWFRRAAVQKNAEAQYRLGVAYTNGEGVTPNSSEAYAWYNVADANGRSGAAAARDRIAERLAPAQMTEAQKVAREYLKRYKRE